MANKEKMDGLIQMLESITTPPQKAHILASAYTLLTEWSLEGLDGLKGFRQRMLVGKILADHSAKLAAKLTDDYDNNHAQAVIVGSDQLQNL